MQDTKLQKNFKFHWPDNYFLNFAGMTDEKLARLQAKSREKYFPTKPDDMCYTKIGIEQNPSFFNPKSVELYKATVVDAGQPAEEEIIEATPKKSHKKKPPVILPDLMACQPEKKLDVNFEKIKEYVDKHSPKTAKKEKKSIFANPQPTNVDFRKINQHAGRAIFDPGDRVQEKIKRPPAIYDNKKSLYGIDYNDL